MITRLMFPLVLIAVLVGCDSYGEPSTDATNGSDAPPVAEPACISDVFPPAPDFVGLDQTAAEELAAERNLQVREVGRDGECFPVTDDLRQDRVNLEYRENQVIAASLY